MSRGREDEEESASRPVGQSARTSQQPIASSQQPGAPSPSFEVEHGHAEYTDAELLEQAWGNAQALILATIAFLDARGIPPDEWATTIGETFSLGWGEPRPWDAGEFLDAMLTNLRAMGAQVVSVELGVDRAEAATTGFPDPELCDLFGVEPARAAAFHGAAAAIAAPRGLRWTWEIEADGVTHYVVDRIAVS